MAINDDSEIVRIILGNARWSLDFCHYVLSEIFDLADEFEGLFTDQEALTQKRELRQTCLPR